ncbi:MAG: carboxylesterase/lipase family protein, partial [Pseudomonadales bacterium]|nr:carboxylesterase/lipase family protein [Pseudomonadales bacterium]
VQAARGKNVTAVTSYGPVRGRTLDGVHCFKGIPYGRETSGKRRFMPPQPPVPWARPLNAEEYGPASPQAGQYPDQSEDCLVMNVWTRGLDDAGKRPIMLWLHGGGFQSLSGSSPIYDGTNLCLRGDVVVMGLNHRLNIFGFLHLGDIAGQHYQDSGNVGMLDIVAALQWIQDNAEHFGGDPDNVTIFGESGGGRKVSTLMGMPAARGLFHRAIVQSGPGLHLQPRDKANDVALAVLAELGLKPSEYSRLHELPKEKLIATYTSVTGRFDADTRSKGRFEHRGLVPTVGVPSLPDYSFDPVASPLSAEVPLLIGSNRHEMTYLWRRDKAVMERTLTREALLARLKIFTSEEAERVLEVYERLYPGLAPAVYLVMIVSDRTYRSDSITIAQRKAMQGAAPCYVYLFEWETNPVMLAHHALEITFVFDNTSREPDMSGGTPEAAALAAKMSEAWIAFARTGNPNTGNLPTWKPYSLQDRHTLLFNNESRLVADPDAEVRQLWATI